MKIKLEKKHYQWGLTAFLVIVCSVLVFFVIYKFTLLSNFFKVCLNILAPFIYGLVMAYLLCPVYNLTVNRTYIMLNRGRYKFKNDLTFAKVVGSIVALVFLLVIITGVSWMIIPGLFDSIVKVVDMLPEGLRNLTEWIDVKFANLPVAKETVDEWSRNITEYTIDYATNTILPKSGDMVTALSGAMINAVGVVVDFVIGVIVCVYFLNIKDTLAAQAKKVIIAHCSENRAKEILEGAEFTNRTFGGFINGKLIDSVIIGLICFFVMTIFGWEYSLLISCIIGITNIIPFFGPFIGAIPSSLLLLMVDPMHCLYFVIFVILLQQFDGNILGPKILGDSTGLASFWVLFAVLVGGGLFGFVGMVLGIPVFAVIYAYVSKALNKRLAKKGFSTDTLDYKVDKYRVRRTKSRNRMAAGQPKKEQPAEPNVPEQREESVSGYENEEVQHTTEEELKQAEIDGNRIMEATVVEFEDPSDK